MLGVITIKYHEGHNTVKTFNNDQLQQALDYCISKKIVPDVYFMQDDDIEDGTPISISAQEVLDLREEGEEPMDITFF